MPLSETPYRRQLPIRAIALSLLLHGLVLVIPQHAPEGTDRPARRIEARLAQPAPATPASAAPAKSASKAAPVKPRVEKRVIALERGKSTATTPPARQWSVKEREEMNNFLNELGAQARPAPTLAQRSLAMARELGREQARQDGEDNVELERLPNGPPVDPFSLEMYLDAMVKKLNRSAAFVKNDPRAKGVRSALVRVRLKPDGSLHSFEVLNAADQHDEIAFIKAVVEQAVPFAAFPADLRKSAKSLGMLICIRPPSSSGGSLGFSRDTTGRGC